MTTQASLLATVWSFWALAFIATTIRIIVRRQIQHKFQAEDYLAVLAFILLTGLTSAITIVTPLFETERDYLELRAVDPHAAPPYPPYMMADRTILALKLMFSQMLLFWSTIWACKFSLLVFVRQSIVGLPKYMMGWWVVAVLVLFSYLGCMLSNFLTYVPLTKYWSIAGYSDGDNLHRSDISIRIATALDIFADLLIMLLPLRLIWTLRTSISQKLALTCLFSLGVVVVIFAFVRLFNFTKATSEGAVNVLKLADLQMTLSFWTQTEAAVSVIAANLPALRSFLRRQLGGPKYGYKESGSSIGTSKKTYQIHNLGTMDLTTRSKSAIRHQSVELASFDENDDEEWPITGKAAEMLGITDRTLIMKSIEAGDTGILATTEVKVTRGPRVEQHMRANSGGNTFGLQLRPDLA